LLTCIPVTLLTFIINTLVKNISYQQVQMWQSNAIPFQLVDVREASEHKAFNIGGVLIPLSEILREKNKLEVDKPIVFYCKKGIRSQIAIQKLLRYFPNADFYNLQSGVRKVLKCRKRSTKSVV